MNANSNHKNSYLRKNTDNKAIPFTIFLCAGLLFVSGCSAPHHEKGSKSDGIASSSSKFEYTIHSDKEDGEGVYPDRVEFESSYKTENNQTFEYAVITAYDESSKELWSVTTDEYQAAQLPQVSEIGLHDKYYYYCEGGSIAVLDPANGSVCWKNSEFDGSKSGFVFDSDENLYVCGSFGPDLFGVDVKGNTLIRIESADEDYYWPGKLTIEDGEIRIHYDGGRYDEGGSVSVEINGKELKESSIETKQSSGNASQAASYEETGGSGTNSSSGYTDEELCRMALDHYEKTEGYRPSEAEIDSYDGDKVTIHLYDDMGTHTATAAWYEVDRNSAKGQDVIFGNEIDLLG